MPSAFFTDPQILDGLRREPLGAHIDGFVHQLLDQDYSRHSGRHKLRLLRHLNHWLRRRRLGTTDLDEDRLAEFIRDRASRVSDQGGDRATLTHFLAQLRRVGAAPAQKPTVPRDARSHLEHSFAEYLSQERGLCQVTINGYLREVGLFIGQQSSWNNRSARRIRARDLNAFVLRRSRQVASKTLRTTVAALRFFCRFLLVRGDVTRDLSGAILAPANWQLTRVPKWLTVDEVERLLSHCDRRSEGGQRDFTVLLILARLGLRAGEVVSMTLDDIDWENGELLVRGKGSRLDRLPLPRDVGGALATYIHRWRPPSRSGRVFLCLNAPRQGFLGSQSIRAIVSSGLRRAGLNPPSRGAHLLRFTLAANILRQGGSLREVSELLRHRRSDTTAIYAKIDLNALRSIAPVWPGVGA